MYERILLKNLHLKDVNPRICGIRDCEPGQIIGSHRLEDYVLHYFGGSVVIALGMVLHLHNRYIRLERSS